MFNVLHVVKVEHFHRHGAEGLKLGGGGTRGIEADTFRGRGKHKSMQRSWIRSLVDTWWRGSTGSTMSGTLTSALAVLMISFEPLTFITPPVASVSLEACERTR